MAIPIGVQDFKKIRGLGGYFVDKSPLIDLVLSDGLTEVFLFTRPRRFGKSTNLSMLDAYLNMEFRGNGWFEGLRISDLPHPASQPLLCGFRHMGEVCGHYQSIWKSSELTRNHSRKVVKSLFLSYKK